MVSESKPARCMYLEGNVWYLSVPHNLSRNIYRSLNSSCASRCVLSHYEHVLHLMLSTEMKPGFVDKGPFVTESVKHYHRTVEYTVNRVSGRNLERLYWSLDFHGMRPNVLVDIPSDQGVLDPRVFGKGAQFYNHSYSCNARPVKLDIRGKTLIFICALRPIMADEEVFVDYQWYTAHPGSPYIVPCLCISSNYRGAI